MTHERQILLLEAMASCHSITYVNNKLLGDPLEIKMFESTNWELDEKNVVSNSSLAINDLILAYVRPHSVSGNFRVLAKQLQSYEDGEEE